MEIKVSTRHGDIRDTDKSYIMSRLRKIGILWDQTTSIEAVVSWDRHNHHKCSDVKIHVEADQNFESEGVGESGRVRPAFSKAMDRMIAQVKKHKEKVINRKRQQSLSEAVAEMES